MSEFLPWNPVALVAGVESKSSLIRSRDSVEPTRAVTLYSPAGSRKRLVFLGLKMPSASSSSEYASCKGQIYDSKVPTFSNLHTLSILARILALSSSPTRVHKSSRTRSYSSTLFARLPSCLHAHDFSYGVDLAGQTHIKTYILTLSRFPCSYTQMSLWSWQCRQTGRSPLHFVFLCLQGSHACVTRCLSPVAATFDTN